MRIKTYIVKCKRVSNYWLLKNVKFIYTGNNFQYLNTLYQVIYSAVDSTSSILVHYPVSTGK